MPYENQTETSSNIVVRSSHACRHRRLKKPIRIFVEVPVVVIQYTVFRARVAVQAVRTQTILYSQRPKHKHRRLRKPFRIALSCLGCGGAGTIGTTAVVTSLTATPVYAEYDPIQTASVVAELQGQDINNPLVLSKYVANAFASQSDAHSAELQNHTVKMTAVAPAPVVRPTASQMTLCISAGTAEEQSETDKATSGNAENDASAGEETQVHDNVNTNEDTRESAVHSGSDKNGESAQSEKSGDTTHESSENTESDSEASKQGSAAQEKPEKTSESAEPDVSVLKTDDSKKQNSAQGADSNQSTVQAPNESTENDAEPEQEADIAPTATPEAKAEDVLDAARVLVPVIKTEEEPIDTTALNAVDITALQETDTDDHKPVNNGITMDLTKESVTVDNGAVFMPESYVVVKAAGTSKLPALKIDSNVDTAVDGQYSVTYTATDISGKKIVKTLGVTVKTPEWVIEARKKAEEEEKARQEAEQKAKEEEARRKAEEEARAQAEAQARAAQASYGAASNVPAANGSASGQNLIATARQYLGSPYVWGGTNPSGFDCSGFVQYVFAMNGIALNRTAAAQVSNGYQISADQVRAGDLMIWSGHVALCEGNGYVIEAGNPSTGVYEHPINEGYGAGYFMGYYRIPGVD